MSVVEGLCAGTSVIVPDVPQLLEFAGPNARPYTTADDIVQHVKEITTGGPEIEAEWQTNREYGLRSFADPALFERFFVQLRDALDAWRGGAGVSRPS
jgi:hypothetical protein